MIRVILPFHLRNLAQVGGDVSIDVAEPITVNSILDALEASYPKLLGTIREHSTKKRRPLLRFFVCEQDWSFEPSDKPLPAAIATGDEPFWVVGAVSGG